MMKSTKEFWSKKQFTDSSSMEQWMKTKQRIGESVTEFRELNTQMFIFLCNKLCQFHLSLADGLKVSHNLWEICLQC